MIGRAVASSIIGGEADISHTIKTIDINCAEHEYMNISSPPIIELATALIGLFLVYVNVAYANKPDNTVTQIKLLVS